MPLWTACVPKNTGTSRVFSEKEAGMVQEWTNEWTYSKRGWWRETQKTYEFREMWISFLHGSNILCVSQAGTGTSSVWYHFKLNYQRNILYNDFDIMQYKEAE